MGEPPNNIRALRLERGWSLEDLAQRAGTSNQQISYLETGKRKLTQEWMRRISVAFGSGVTAADLLPNQLGTSQPLPAGLPMTLPKDLPVLGTALGGPHGALQLTNEVVEMVRRPPALDKVTDAYALYVEGTSMEPRYFMGEMIYVHPKRPANPGDFVVVQYHPKTDDEEASPLVYVKRLVRRTAKRLILEQYNPKGTIELDITKCTVHRIIPNHELYGF